MFFEGLSSSKEYDSLPASAKMLQRWRKASAWYLCCYGGGKKFDLDSSASHEARVIDDDTLVGFPWTVWDVLLEIKKKQGSVDTSGL